MIRRFLASAVVLIVIAGCSKSTETLVNDLKSDNPDARRNAAVALTQGHGDTDPVPLLIDLLGDANERTVFLATQVLGNMADTTAVDPLGTMLDNPNASIRASAAWSLGNIGHVSAYPYLVKALNDSQGEVRHSAVYGLGHLHYAPAIEPLFRMLRDPVDSVRVQTVYSLYLYRSDKEADIHAADFAVPLQDSSDVVRYVTVQALGYAYPDSNLAGQMLIDMLRDVNKHVRIEAIVSLKKLNYAPAVPELKNMYDLATVEEEYEISETIRAITGEPYPPEEI